MRDGLGASIDTPPVLYPGPSGMGPELSLGLPSLFFLSPSPLPRGQPTTNVHWCIEYSRREELASAKLISLHQKGPKFGCLRSLFIILFNGFLELLCSHLDEVFQSLTD
ncbi:hypothetical protein LB505_010830 [Fusarium chuoi]|nr:hypothetical protein LB505_010830 [Fusarium chuoi]